MTKDQELKKAGLKITTQRLKILQILEQTTERHLTAEDIFGRLNEAGEEIGLATVYRVLTQFEEAGLVIRHHFEGDQSFFVLDEGEHHDKLVCVKCGKVAEFIDPIIEARQEAIAKEAGFTITDHSLNVYGICKDCQK